MSTKRRIDGRARWFGVALVLALLAPQMAGAGQLTCITGTDPIVANDGAQIAVLQATIDGACTCDGFPSHGKFMRCVRPLVKSAVLGGALRKKCTGAVMRYYRKSTCSHPVGLSGHRIPCLRQTAASSKVRCSIKPAAKCGDATGSLFNQDGCPGYTFCAEAGDTNGDLRVGAGDTYPIGGRCAGPVCGDNVVDAGEECDDGVDNADAPNACRTSCVSPACGDGIVDTGEGCDDANLGCGPDQCRPDCSLPGCGDEIVDSGEECDDGDAVADPCDSGAGPDNDDTLPDHCRTSCTNPACGDDVVSAVPPWERL
jgi:hypothetical protein